MDQVVLLTEKELRREVSYLLRRPISRTRLYQLRRELGFSGCEFEYSDARAIAYYAQLRSARVAPQVAKQRTIQYSEVI